MKSAADLFLGMGMIAAVAGLVYVAVVLVNALVSLQFGRPELFKQPKPAKRKEEPVKSEMYGYSDQEQAAIEEARQDGVSFDERSLEEVLSMYGGGKR